ncbi:bifunctional protein-serine/threonine kinase/phosphatase [Gayadomonas joobiniege]|uniref:bifunctional protein-serine/threonine kinase/phosphatase n=1 Tax=Gayadomonas joobiniege TaxID=1234606 RepID=UPI000373B75B|nr:bifunctional protein-serine/threonine kinase/phosphatase [Gayadomonas joobiniege]
MSKTQLQVRIGAASSAGPKSVNQDAVAAQVGQHAELKNKGIAAAIADGVSSSLRSQEAAQLCTTQFINDYFATPETWSVNQASARVLTALNAWLYNQNQQDQQDPLVTTFSALVIKSCTAHLFHLGDSRIYQYRDGQLSCLTRDHLHISAKNSYLTRAMGIDSHIEVDYQTIDLNQNDIFLLSTDGLHEFVSDSQFCQHLAAMKDPDDCAQQLLELALAQGSNDNLSCLILSVDQLPHENLQEAHRRVTSLVIPPVLKVGQKIDDFIVRRVLFSGTRSHVFLVEDTHQRQYALKMPSANFADSPEYLDGFLREEWIGGRIEHENVMRIFPRPKNSPFMYHLCEYLKGLSLRKWMQENPKPQLHQVREIMAQVIHALRYFQRNGMVHRDLKPENIIIDPYGAVKIIDFGTVSVEGLQDIQNPLQETCPVGSVDYIAPEFAVNQQSNFQADLYSAGVIFYEAYTGHLPFQLDGLQHKIPSNYNFWQYQSALTVRPDTPVWLDLALQKACAPHPKHRYQAFSEFLQDVTTANSRLLKRYQQAPLLEKHPLIFWQTATALMLLLNIILAYFLLV